MQSFQMVFGMEQCTSNKRRKINHCPSLCCVFLLSCYVFMSWWRLPKNSKYARYKDVLINESRMKNHRCWIQWQTPLLRLSGSDWIIPWLQALFDCGLPGRDFTVLGLRKNCLEWA